VNVKQWEARVAKARSEAAKHRAAGRLAWAAALERQAEADEAQADKARSFTQWRQSWV